MPLAAMVSQSNQWLSAASTIKLVKERPDIVEILGVRGKLPDAAEKLLNVDPAGIAYLKAMPGPVQETIRAAIYDAITGRGRQQQPKPVLLSYIPAVEFSASVSDFGEAVSIQVRGPYEASSPGARFAASRARARTRTGTKSGRSRASTRAKRKPARRPGR